MNIEAKYECMHTCTAWGAIHLDVEASEQYMLVLVHQPNVVHQLESLEPLLDPRRHCEHLRLLRLVQSSARPTTWNREVVVSVEADASRCAPFCERREKCRHP
eukprot:COSAG02_NODE_10516_length_1924_cov_1.806027_1_plen_103_part_00